MTQIKPPKLKNSSNLLEVTELGSEVAKGIENYLLQENKDLRFEIEVLKKQLQVLRAPKVSKLILSDEMIIAETQLMRLKEKALAGELTIEDTKKYDLLVKNKRLSEGNSTINAEYKKLPDDITDDDLLKLAASSNKASNGEEN